MQRSYEGKLKSFFFKPAKSAECLAPRQGPWLLKGLGTFESVSLIHSKEKPILLYLVTNLLHPFLSSFFNRDAVKGQSSIGFKE